MKGCIITPTRGDRPEFLELCKKMVAYQTVQLPHIICDHAPKSVKNDISERYKWLFNQAFNVEGYDFAVVFEDDDYYPENYVKNIIEAWQIFNRPIVLGSSQTVYLHIDKLKSKVMLHKGRSSMFSMLLSKEIKDVLLSDSPFIDLEISKINGANFIAHNIFNIGIKHGKGLTVGAGHKQNFNWDKQLTLKEFNKLTNNFYAQNYFNTSK